MNNSVEEKEIRRWSKILEPPCLGNWDCLVNPKNPYYEEMRKALALGLRLSEVCSCMDRCIKRKRGEA